MNTEVAEEPAALKTLASCGAHWQSQCLHEPPCQKHAVAAAFLQMLSPPPSAAIVEHHAASVEHHAMVPLKSPPSREQCAAWGRQGALKRKRWLLEHQDEVQKYYPGLDRQKKVECVEQIKKTKPMNFSHSWKEKAYWREQASKLRVKESQLKNAWKKHKDEDADIVKKGFRDRYWKTR